MFIFLLYILFEYYQQKFAYSELYNLFFNQKCPFKTECLSSSNTSFFSLKFEKTGFNLR